MPGTKWKTETYGGHEVVIYENCVENDSYEGNEPRTVFGRVKCKGRWIPQAWTAKGRAFDKGNPHPLDLFNLVST